MLKRIGVDQLELGMHIKEFCGSWMDHPFWRTGFVLKEPHDLVAIRASSVREVWIDSSKGKDVESGVDAVTAQQAQAAVKRVLEQAAVPRRPAATAPVAIGEEIERAVKICAASKQAVESMFHDARLGRAVDTESARALVEDISDSVTRNRGAIISLARLKTADDYTYMHSVAVCALMVALARQLHLDDAQTRSAGLAGLLHDLGKARMPLEVLNKPGQLTPEEFAIMKGHPVEGHGMLLGAAQADPVARDVCLHHHEKMNGSGYPEGLRGEQISVFARMGAVCDVYDAITSDRPYKAGWDPSESLRKMAEWCSGHFDTEIFQAFVKSLGIYPIGSLVRLASGHLGVVVEQSGNSLLAPRVKLFYSVASDSRIPPRVVDLSAPDANNKIVGREDPAKWRFPDLDALWTGLELPHRHH